MKLLLHLLALVCFLGFATNTAALDFSRLRARISELLGELLSTRTDAILYWNAVTLEACANDYDPSMVPSPPDQPGPTATSRAFAIIHGAMYDAMAAFNRQHRPMYKPNNMPNTNNVHAESATNAAIMEAAYQTLCSLYPKQRAMFDSTRQDYLGQLKKDGNKQAGINRGILVSQLIAAFILAERQNDRSRETKAYAPVPLPGNHQVDPTHPNQGFLGVNWGNVTTFLLNSGSQYRPPNIVGNTLASRVAFLTSNRYIKDYNEVKSFGSKASSARTNDQTEVGIFWAYDGVPKLGVPPRLYNQIVRVIAIQQRNTLAENARLFALTNYAMADAGIAAWDCKYFYNIWRPIVGIRQAQGYGQADPNWLPLGAPASNGASDFTPGFPSFVSGHSTFGSAVFEVLRLFYGTDRIPFRFQSDEFNGRTLDANTRQPRSSRTRSYRTFSEAETENYLSRVYLGVHWRFDQESGKIVGRQVGQHVFNRFR